MESNLYQALGKFFLAMQFRSFAVIFEAAASATAVPNTIVVVPIECFPPECEIIDIDKDFEVEQLADLIFEKGQAR